MLAHVMFSQAKLQKSRCAFPQETCLPCQFLHGAYLKWCRYRQNFKRAEAQLKRRFMAGAIHGFTCSQFCRKRVCPDFRLPLPAENRISSHFPRCTILSLPITMSRNFHCLNLAVVRALAGCYCCLHVGPTEALTWWFEMFEPTALVGKVVGG